MSNALDEFKGVADAGITPDDNPGLEAFVEGAGEMPAPQPLVELVKPAKKGDNVLIQIEMYLQANIGSVTISCRIRLNLGVLWTKTSGICEIMIIIVFSEN